MFLVVQNIDFTRYADDKNTLTQVTIKMRSFVPCKNCLKSFLKWFAENKMKSITDKCNLLVSTSDIAEIQIADFSGKKNSCEKLLNVNIDSKFNFDSHVNHLCSKTSKKLKAFARVRL